MEKKNGFFKKATVTYVYREPCAKCDEPLVNDSLKLDDNSEVQISKCPNGHGKIKSPMCCGQDMTCTVK